jgi:hypothetical protein
MATEKQIAANRANAQKSTGPRTHEGKAVSSQNALKSGIDAQSQVIRGEDPVALAALTDQYLADFQPRSAAERALVDALIDNEWLLRRLRKAESQLWEQGFDDVEHWDQTNRREHSPTALNGRVYSRCAETLTRLERRRELAQRAYHRTLQDLLHLQAAHPPQHQNPAPAEEIGFVPESPNPSGPPAGPLVFDPAHPVPSLLPKTGPQPVQNAGWTPQLDPDLHPLTPSLHPFTR